MEKSLMVLSILCMYSHTHSNNNNGFILSFDI